MRNKILFICLLFFPAIDAVAQQPAERNKLRIVDTLTAQERNNRNPVILKAELDSLVQAYMAANPQNEVQEPVKEYVSSVPQWVMIVGVVALVFIALLLYRLFRNQGRFSKIVSDLKRQIRHLEMSATAESSSNGAEKLAKGKSTLEKKLQELSAELDKQKRSSQAALLDYEQVKRSITESFKLKNYPGYDKDKRDGQNITALLATERTVANYAFEKFLKPVIAIADANKNNPARISKEDSDRILELLISLSLYYSEYLYLRINDLAVGGNIVQRISTNGNGSVVNPALLKRLNTDHGSRALTVRMALNKAGVERLTYPVFDDTDLNNF